MRGPSTSTPPRRFSLARTISLGIGLFWCGPGSLSLPAASSEKFDVSHSTKDFARDCVGRETEKLFVLSFDDGPWEYTEAMLDILAEKGAPATFFVIGSIFAAFPGHAEEYQGLVRRMLTEGHVIANHGMDNDEYTLDDVEKCHIEIKSITNGHDMQHFRPAQGAYTMAKYQQLVDVDYKTVMWNLDVQDWLATKNPETMLEQVRQAVRNPTGQAAVTDLANYGLPRRGSYIMLAHDNHDKMLQTVSGGQTLLGTMIDEIRSSGYRIVSLNECLGTDIPGSGNYCGSDFQDAKKCGGGECPGGLDGECPNGKRCFGSVVCSIGDSDEEDFDSSDVGNQTTKDDWDWSRLQSSGPPRSSGMSLSALGFFAVCGLAHLF